jgi:PAP2 superfamily.
MSTGFRRTSVILAAALFVAACSEPVSQIGGIKTPGSVSNSAVKFWEVGSSVRWNRKTVSLFRARGGDFGRMNAYATLASYRAALAAQAARDDGEHPSTAGAIAGAAVVVLKQFFPLDASNIEAEIAAQRGDPKWPGEENTDFAAGEAMGRAIGAQVLASMATDNYNVESPGLPPVGAGYWRSAVGVPIIRQPYHARPFFLHTTDEIVIPPPPAFGSAEYLAALAAVRQLSDNRTPAQMAITLKWIPFSSPLFDSVTADLAVKYHKNDLEAARIFAYANLAAYDAIIACFNNKYRYWFIRPSQADPLITTPFGLPNHPSYPSAHSCQAGAWVEVLSDAFPAERDMVKAMGDEAAISRQYGGLHYKFDNDAGLALGHTAGRIALERRGIE